MKVKLNGNDFFRVTSEYGAMEKGLRSSPHTGLDLAMPDGTELFSPVDGIIKNIVDYGDKNVGKGIFIETEDGKTVILGHLSEFKAKVGQMVQEGDLVALSGNTGNSTGSHLHLGLKDASGQFINPDQLLANRSLNDVVFQKEGIITKFKSVTEGTNDVGFFDGAKSFGDFLYKWHETGSFWQAMYGKPFFEVMKDFFAQLGHDILVFVTTNGDIFFLLPAIALMLATFMIGKNKYSKFILPLWFVYFVSSIVKFII